MRVDRNLTVKPFSGCYAFITRYHQGRSIKDKIAALLLLMTLLTIMGFTSLVLTFSSSPSEASIIKSNRIYGHTQHLRIFSSGELEVRETLEVDYARSGAHSGILRELPKKHHITTVTYKSALDERPGVIVPPFAYSGNTVNIGDPNTFLEPGRHRYQVTYVADGEIERLNGQASLTWNITGNQRSLPISVIHFRAALPSSVKPSDVRASLFAKTSATPAETFGSFIKKVSAEDLYFRTTRPLKFNESLLIHLSWEEVS